MLREVDESEWGELGKALIQSFEQVDEEDEPFGEPNAEYCWSVEPDHNGGWFCHHPDCTVSPYTDEQEIQALERLDQHLDGDRESSDLDS
ncbi:MAG: hypothetical protein AUF65_01300 [Chloroflexi bacterium 13_1_20CM_50_12]|nr:MAG: hypothetical protein AUF65_01300 [Chloroflexi bacterium 13_1_20CM_50_12]